MKRLAIIISLTLIYLPFFSQISFEKIYSTSIFSGYMRKSKLILLPDSGYLFAATDSTQILNYGRISKSGAIMWSKKITNGYPDADIAIIGNCAYMVYLGYPTTQYISSVIKFDLNGNTVWFKSYLLSGWPASIHDLWQIRSMQGALYLCGLIRYNSGSACQQFCVQKIDTSGNFVWGKELNHGGLTSFPGISIIGNKNILAYGRTVDTVSGTSYHFTTKLDSSGTVIANRRTWDSNLYWQSIIPFSATEDASGNLYFTGYNDSLTGAGFGYRDIFLMKLSPSLNFQWMKVYGGADIDQGWNIYPNHNNGIKLIADPRSFGTGTVSRITMIQTDNAGNILWAKQYGSTLGSFPNSTVINKDRGFTILGAQADYYNYGRMTLIRTDSLGNSTCPHTLVTIPQASVTLTQDSAFSVVSYTASGTYTPVIVNTTLSNADFCYPTGIQDKGSPKMQVGIFPNPSNGIYNLSMEREGSHVGIVQDIYGTELLRFSFKGNRHALNLEHLKEGVYFVTIGSVTKKIIKE